MTTRQAMSPPPLKPKWHPYVSLTDSYSISPYFDWLVQVEVVQLASYLNLELPTGHVPRYPNLQGEHIDFANQAHSDIILTWHKSWKILQNCRKLVIKSEHFLSAPWQNVKNCRKVAVFSQNHDKMCRIALKNRPLFSLPQGKMCCNAGVEI